MSELKVSWRNVIIFAGAYVATIIGSGFATGQEIMQFFTFYGLTGIFGCVVTLIVFSFTGMECLSRGRVVETDETVQIFSFYCGKYFGKFLEYFVPLFLFGVYVIMISGAGATLEEHYHLNPYIGRILMSLAAFFSVIFGLKGMMKIVGKIGPIIIIFAVTVGLISLLQNYGTLQASLDALPTLDLVKPAPNGIISGLLYPSYNMLVVVGLLSGMGKMANNKKECLYGGFLGGFLLFLAALLMHLAMLSQVENVVALKIPSLYLASHISPMMAKVFSIILMLGIYTTAAPLLWQTVNRFVPDNHPKFKMTTVAITVIGFICGLLPFDRLIGTIYPFTGYIGIVVFLLMVIKVVRLKVSK
ncbi:MAG: hypothetical protein E6276_07720 [Clostridiales bacterium]|nr:hypothetical protein [Peptococcus niger]MDU7245251.1 hypothetical protein [Clostridiales bacterium]